MLGIVATLLLLFTTHRLYLRLASSPLEPPSFSISFLPSFLSGLIAVVRLGADEDSFLRSLQQTYGSVVYLPWPLKQFVVLEAEPIDQVYKAPSKVLSFLPIRREMQHTAFDAGSYWKNKEIMHGFYDVHSRGLQKPQLGSSLERFISVATQEIENFATRLDQAPNGELEVDFDKWITDVFFEASLVGLFGPSVREASGISKEEFRAAFESFDDAFPLLASGFIPAPLTGIILKKGKKGQKMLAEAMQKWIEAGFPGLEKGVVRDMAQNALDRKLSTWEVGKLIVADAWALQANAPYVASQLLLYLLQAPKSLLDDVVEEIDGSSSQAIDSASSSDILNRFSQDFPLLQSCITETLRLGTSVFSIRDVEQPLHLRSRDSSETIVPPNSRLICATRTSHLDPTTWGEDVFEWDGKRFFDGNSGEASESKDERNVDEAELKSRRSRQVWGFGGGISRCEGNLLATFELKSFVSSVLSTFDIELLGPSSDNLDRYETVRFSGASDGIRPKRKLGRVGLGVFQFDADVRVKIRRRSRKE